MPRIKRITKITAEFLVSTGNYCNERIGFEVEPDFKDLDPESLATDEEWQESINEIVDTLRKKATAAIGKPAEDLYREKYRLENAVELSINKLQELTNQYNQLRDFFRAQGIAEMPPIPEYLKLLRPSKEPERESIIVATGEVEDDDIPFEVKDIRL
ncbi:hypothetical protein [Coleofasciculus sp.]|uniref:hypothetical protein n=1 Tax=Coleofasciculus sp. TaxID=3100458 RepID=UPI0039F8F0FA